MLLHYHISVSMKGCWTNLYCNKTLLYLVEVGILELANTFYSRCMGDYKKQHSVTKAYLRNFTDFNSPTNLLQLSKADGSVRPRNIDKCSVRTYYYSIRTERRLMESCCRKAVWLDRRMNPSQSSMIYWPRETSTYLPIAQDGY